MNQADHPRTGPFRRPLIAGGAALLVLAIAAAWLLAPAADGPSSERPTAQPPASGEPPAADAIADPPDTDTDAHLRTVAIPVDGMVCTVCTAGVRRTLAGVEGVHAVEVSLADRRAIVRYHAGEAGPDALAEALAGATRFRIGEPQPIED